MFTIIEIDRQFTVVTREEIEKKIKEQKTRIFLTQMADRMTSDDFRDIDRSYEEIKRLEKILEKF